MARKKRQSRVRFARVPAGGETCPFCLMLASRGAVYYTEETAGANSHYHAHCRCQIVPSWDGAAIEGYDPDLYYDMWKHPEKYSTEPTREEARDVVEETYQKIVELFSDVEKHEERIGELRKELHEINVKTIDSRSDDALYERFRTEGQRLHTEYQQAMHDLKLLKEAQSNVVRRIIGGMRELGPEQGKTAADYFTLQCT